MKIVDALLGRPLASAEEEEQKIGVLAGIPFLGLDALASAAYGPEAALTVLLPLGALGITYALPITLVILAILGVLYFSYHQTIQAYPNGGGSYTVAHENLGETAGLFAASALMVDYVLTAAVGISAGVGALVSAAPSLHPYLLQLTLGILAVVTMVNLRGIRESGLVFAAPTYVFIVTLFATLAWGFTKCFLSGWHPVAVVAPPIQAVGQSPSSQFVMIWLLLRAFASGCTAMTGVEAVSNGVGAFAMPTVKNAHRTLGAIVGVLAILLLGIALLARAYHIGATDPDSAGYQSIISQLVAAIWGRNVFYYITLGSVLAVLALSANTGFADFPRLCRLAALDGFLPHSFAARGRRLVFTLGILVLTGFTAVLLIAFGGVTDRLIPLFAVGAFVAFTLSQAGMVVHWKKIGGPQSHAPMLINLVGAIATGAAVVVVTVAKFAEGAWITVILIPALVYLFRRVKGHYEGVRREVEIDAPLNILDLQSPVVVVPIRAWTTVSEKALRFGMRISDDVYALHVMADESKTPEFARHWDTLVEKPSLKASKNAPKLHMVRSPFRKLLNPIIDFVAEVRKQHPDRVVAVIVPELQEAKWYQYLLHNQRAQWLKAALILRGDRRVVVISVPWYLSAPGSDRRTG